MEQNKVYNIKVEILGRILLYSKSKVISMDENFVTFIDSHTNKPISYNLNVVVFFEEVVE
jgi:L-cysteine desulfidase